MSMYRKVCEEEKNNPPYTKKVLTETNKVEKVEKGVKPHKYR